MKRAAVVLALLLLASCVEPPPMVSSASSDVRAARSMSLGIVAANMDDEWIERVVSVRFAGIPAESNGLEVTFRPPVSTMMPPQTIVIPRESDGTALAEFRVTAPLADVRRSPLEAVTLPDRQGRLVILNTTVQVGPLPPDYVLGRRRAVAP